MSPGIVSYGVSLLLCVFLGELVLESDEESIEAIDPPFHGQYHTISRRNRDKQKCRQTACGRYLRPCWDHLGENRSIPKK
jgi:hypothetical protein